jgi:hypothetical protein
MWWHCPAGHVLAHLAYARAGWHPRIGHGLAPPAEASGRAVVAAIVARALLFLAARGPNHGPCKGTIVAQVHNRAQLALAQRSQL